MWFSSLYIKQKNKFFLKLKAFKPGGQLVQSGECLPTVPVIEFDSEDRESFGLVSKIMQPQCFE